jgi:hypothetical protein
LSWAALVSPLPIRAFGEQSAQDWMQRSRPTASAGFSIRTEGTDDEGKRELRLRFVVTSSANSSRSIACAAYREILEKRVNTNCSNACWLRWCAGNLTEIFVIAFT